MVDNSLLGKTPLSYFPCTSHRQKQLMHLNLSRQEMHQGEIFTKHDCLHPIAGSVAKRDACLCPNTCHVLNITHRQPSPTRVALIIPAMCLSSNAPAAKQTRMHHSIFRCANIYPCQSLSVHLRGLRACYQATLPASHCHLCCHGFGKGLHHA